MSLRGDPVDLARCDRCGAPVQWAHTDRGGKMPLDYEPVGDDDRDGPAMFVLLDSVPGSDPVCVGRSWFYAGPKPMIDPIGRVAFYRSHSASCPHADRHRKR